MSITFTLNKDDLIKVGKGSLIAGAGALLVYLIQGIAGLSFGLWTPAVTALGGILANIVRKYLKAT